MVAAYGLILPKTVLETPRLGCINVHGSLLPRWRGAAPIQRAILNQKPKHLSKKADLQYRLYLKLIALPQIYFLSLIHI